MENLSVQRYHICYNIFGATYVYSIFCNSKFTVNRITCLYALVLYCTITINSAKSGT